MKRNICSIIILLGAVISLAGCGSSGGGNVTKATLKLATSGTGTTIYGIDVTVNLPDGVSVKSSDALVDTDVITPSGSAASGSMAAAVYTAATGSAPGKVRIMIISMNGFSTGEFCTVDADIEAGHSPRGDDFSLVDFSAWNENAIDGLTPGFTADIH